MDFQSLKDRSTTNHKSQPLHSRNEPAEFWRFWFGRRKWRFFLKLESKPVPVDIFLFSENQVWFLLIQTSIKISSLVLVYILFTTSSKFLFLPRFITRNCKPGYASHIFRDPSAYEPSSKRPKRPPIVCLFFTEGLLKSFECTFLKIIQPLNKSSCSGEWTKISVFFHTKYCNSWIFQRFCLLWIILWHRFLKPLVDIKLPLEPHDRSLHWNLLRAEPWSRVNGQVAKGNRSTCFFLGECNGRIKNTLLCIPFGCQGINVNIFFWFFILFMNDCYQGASKYDKGK